jgi:hypothetical protein
MLAVGWIDNRPVHFISTADSTKITTVSRRVGKEKMEVNAPLAIKNYNKFMGGIDRHDRLRSTFSICKKHKFKKYYVKLFLFLLDVTITNSWIYYKLSNPEMKDKGGARATFYQELAESLVDPNIDWKDRYGEREKKRNRQGDNSLNDSPNQIPSEICRPIPLSSLGVELSMKKKVCQVCNYESLGRKWKSVVMCSRHGVRVCLQVRKPRKDVLPLLKKTDGTPVSDWSWTCPDEKSCWDKLHDFYLPNKLFNTHFYVNDDGNKCKFAGVQYSCKLYEKKYEAMGNDKRRRRGKGTGRKTMNQNNTDTVLPEDECSSEDNEERSMEKAGV